MKGNLNISAWISSADGLCATPDRLKLDGLSGRGGVIKARKPPKCAGKTSSMEIKCSLISVLKPSSCHWRRLLYLCRQCRLGVELALITDPCPTAFCLRLRHWSAFCSASQGPTHLSSSRCEPFCWSFSTRCHLTSFYLRWNSTLLLCSSPKFNWVGDEEENVSSCANKLQCGHVWTHQVKFRRFFFCLKMSQDKARLIDHDFSSSFAHSLVNTESVQSGFSKTTGVTSVRKSTFSTCVHQQVRVWKW